MTTPVPYSVINGTLVNVNDTVSIYTGYTNSVGIHLGSVSAVGQNIVFEQTIDGATWIGIDVYTVGTTPTLVASATATGDFEVASGATTQFRVRLTAITSGSVPVSLAGTVGETGQTGGGSSGGGGAVTITGNVLTVDGTLTPKGFQQIVTATLAASTALGVPNGSRIAVIQAVGQAISWRDDGTAPTATIGMSIPAGGELVYDGTLTAIRLIQVASGATANISYYG